jgi:hypothetical protein
LGLGLGLRLLLLLLLGCAHSSAVHYRACHALGYTKVGKQQGH